MHADFLLGCLVPFIDSRFKTDYTCCHGQWHKYITHAAMFGISYQVLKKAVYTCLEMFNPDTLFLYHCQYDKNIGCNRAEEVSSKSLIKRNCKEDKPQCHQSKFDEYSSYFYFWDTYTFFDAKRTSLSTRCSFSP